MYYKTAGQTMKDWEKGIRVLKADGIRAAGYALVYALRERASAQNRYNQWIQKFEYQLPAEKAAPGSGPSIALISADAQMAGQIRQTSADYYAFCYPGDLLHRDWEQMTAAYIQRHPKIRFFYTDEDRMQDGIRKDPILKPDWSPDTYLSYDYVGGLLVMDSALATEALEILTAAEHMEERYGCGMLYALGLCAAELIAAEEIGHFRRVLYHRRESVKIPAEQLLCIKTDLIKRRGLTAVCETEKKSGEVRIVYTLSEEPFVSIIVPSKDQPELLSACMESTEKYTAYTQYEWIVVDNGSTEENRKRYVQIAESASHPCRYLYEPMEFNFAKMCNLGAAEARGSCLLFLNDDIAFDDSCSVWLARLVGQAMQPETGSVGAKLLYPDSTRIQHVGVVNFHHGATHLFRGCDDLKVLPFYKNCLDTNTTLLTGALLAVEKEKFTAVGGFSEEMEVTYNDVDLCLKLLEHGWRNVLRSDAVAFHYESYARGEDAADEEKYRRCLEERERVFAGHKAFRGTDPAYHPYLSQSDPNAGVAARYLPPPGKAKKLSRTPKPDMPEPGSFRIDQIDADEWCYIRGYVFTDNPGKEKVRILFQGEQTFCFDTRPYFDHTMTPLMHNGKSYAFCGFEALIRHLALPEDNYRILLEVGNLTAETGENCLTLKNR